MLFILLFYILGGWCYAENVSRYDVGLTCKKFVEVKDQFPDNNFLITNALIILLNQLVGLNSYLYIQMWLYSNIIRLK